MKSIVSALTLGLTLTLGSTQAQVTAPAAQSSTSVVATAAAVDGTVFVTRAGTRQVLLARGSSLQAGDAINTTRNSTVRIKFTDGGETVIRPESTLVLQAYQFQKEAPANDSLLLNLLKGGLRALTGAVGKRGDVNAYQVRANTATVGIRGTDFSLRLCQQDCDVGPDAKVQNSATPVAARAVQVRGVAKVSRRGGALATLNEGEPLYSGDALQTQLDSHVVLVFSDGSRITVNPSSQMSIAEYSDNSKVGSTGLGSMVVDMFKGGLRMATGLIGKSNPEKVKIRTATATVGIRGTVFDLVCAPAGSPDGGSATDLGDMPCDESLLAQTRDGIITLSGTQGEALVLPVGQSGRVSGPNAAARPLQATPDYFRNLQTPAPESVPANMEALFGLSTLPDTSDGVLLTVHEGQVVLAQAQKEVLLDAGESAFAGRAAIPVRLQSVPPVLDRDPFLSGSMFSTNMCRR
ncbi:MAG: FecR domain-containing protein [Rhodoferax sp.]